MSLSITVTPQSSSQCLQHKTHDSSSVTLHHCHTTVQFSLTDRVLHKIQDSSCHSPSLSHHSPVLNVYYTKHKIAQVSLSITVTPQSSSHWQTGYCTKYKIAQVSLSITVAPQPSCWCLLHKIQDSSSVTLHHRHTTVSSQCVLHKIQDSSSVTLHHCHTTVQFSMFTTQNTR